MQPTIFSRNEGAIGKVYTISELEIQMFSESLADSCSAGPKLEVQAYIGVDHGMETGE
jgi:hypothetical protein